MKIPGKTFLTLLVLGAFLLTLAVAGCDSKGPAEQVGEKIDKSVESVKDAADEAIDKVDGDGPAEELGEKLDEAAEKVKSATE